MPRSGITKCLVTTCLLSVAACGSAAQRPTLSNDTIGTVADTTVQTTIGPETEAETSGPLASVPDGPLSGVLTVTIVDTHPHDSTAFTQGLELIDQGRMLETTGLYGESDRRLVDIESGEVLEILEIDTDLFGEGATVVGDELLQLTWKAGVLIRSDLATLDEVSRDTYEGEGWGLCFDGESLAMSNGTSALTFRNPETFDAIRTVEVTLGGEPVERLNELECVNGQVFANVWLSDVIVVIDPATGEVVATLDGSVLRPPELSLDESSFALNGIAHDPDTGHYYLTGKLWPVLYEVQLS